MKQILKDARRWLPGLVISLVAIAILSKAVDWESVGVAFVTANWWFILLQGIFYFLSVGSRAMASRTLLQDRPTFRDSFIVMMQGYLLNNVLPLRLGELGRAYLLGRKTGLGTFHALPAIVIERFYDLAFAAIVLIATLPFVLSGTDWAGPVSYSTLVVVAVGLLSMHLVARFREPIKVWVDKLGHRIALVERFILPHVDSFLDGLSVLTNTRSFLLSLFWMALTWAFGVGYMYFMLLAFQPDGHILQSTFAFGASSFAGAIPSAPSSLGVFEGAMVAAYAIVGIGSGVALAAAVFHHLAHIVYSGLVGMYGFSRDDIGLMEMYERLTSRSQEQE